MAKKFIELRYQLLPYIYTAFWQYSKVGTPMLRPLAFLDQTDTETYFRKDEFGVGDEILVCPITQAEVDGRWLYLPEGRWFYYWDDEQFQGGMEVWAEASLDRVPMFIRAGAVIPHYPIMQYVGEFQIEELNLHIYFTNKNHNSTMYEDSGDDYGYGEGLSLVKTFKTSGTENTFSIQQIKQGDFQPLYNNYEMILHGLPFEPKVCSVDGSAVDFEIVNQAKNMIKVKVNKEFQKIEVSN
jgi:alpha-glucosidase